MRVILALALLATACSPNFVPGTQPDPVSQNEVFMVAETHRMEPMLNMGQFVILFGKPPSATYAGWADCQLGGGRPPYYIHYNQEYINGINPERVFYLSSLVAHEMCHHWVEKQQGSCWDEHAAEVCASNLLSKRQPK